MIENAISVEEVAKVTGLTPAAVEEEAGRLGLFVGEDWGGRRSMSEWDAHLLSSGQARKQQEGDRAWLQHREDTSRWESDRQAVYLAAHAEEYRRAGGAMAGRRSDLAAQKAGDQAVATWEKRHPAPRWQGGEQTASLWRRVADAVAEAVR